MPFRSFSRKCRAFRSRSEAGASVHAMRTASPRPLLAALRARARSAVRVRQGAEPQRLPAGGPPRKLAPVAAQGAVSVARATPPAWAAPTLRRTPRRSRARPTRASPPATARRRSCWSTSATGWPRWPPRLLASAPPGAPILYSEGKPARGERARRSKSMHPAGSTGARRRAGDPDRRRGAARRAAMLRTRCPAAKQPPQAAAVAQPAARSTEALSAPGDRPRCRGAAARCRCPRRALPRRAAPRSCS